MSNIRMTHAEGAPTAPQALTVAPPDTSVVSPEVGASIDSVRGEIEDAYEEMERFHNQEPDYCIRIITGHSARLSHLSSRIRRIEKWHPDWKELRTGELAEALRELKDQFEMASRRHTIREWDYRVETGER